MLPTYVLVTAPTVDVVTLDEVKRHVRAEDFTDDDQWLAAAIKTFAGRLDAQRGWLGRALRPQTWEYRLHDFPWGHHCGHYRGIELPYPPFNSLTSLKYDDTAGVERTLVENADFKIIGVGSDQPVTLIPVYGSSWPSTRCAPESVRIRYACGYAGEVTGEGAHPDLLPPEVRQWILANVATAYENRESVVVGRSEGLTNIPSIADDLVFGLKTFWFA